mmetsp:Transcript_49391/g.138330  ORF Transcript_49391/g.138330 Transcript_49391/m.138330 type:complete len:153 (+) Transcript_49391:96-554(+)
MAHVAARRSLATVALAVAAILVLTQAPGSFVPQPSAAPVVLPVAAASALAASTVSLPAWAHTPEFAEAQIVLAQREVGGKFAKSKGLVMPVPEEEGFSDAQVALCLVIALVCGILAWNLGLALQTGLQPQRWTKKKGGYITPLVKRFIEMTD